MTSTLLQQDCPYMEVSTEGSVISACCNPSYVLTQRHDQQLTSGLEWETTVLGYFCRALERLPSPSFFMPGMLSFPPPYEGDDKI